MGLITIRKPGFTLKVLTAESAPRDLCTPVYKHEGDLQVVAGRDAIDWLYTVDSLEGIEAVVGKAYYSG